MITADDATTLTVPRRFCGPPSSGNGGWSAGALAALLAAPGDGVAVRVRLRQPPPLDVALAVAGDGDRRTASHERGVVLEAERATLEPTPTAPVDLARAEAASAAYPGLVSHPFPTCFVCGTERAAGDGLRIFPGPIGSAEGTTRVAAPWTPQPSQTADDPAHASWPVTWAALDCAGAWACDLSERMMVLGQMTAIVDRLPRIGAPHVVIGEDHGSEGRKNFSTVSLLDADGDLLAQASQIWITVDPARFG